MNGFLLIMWDAKVNPLQVPWNTKGPAKVKSNSKIVKHVALSNVKFKYQVVGQVDKSIEYRYECESLSSCKTVNEQNAMRYHSVLCIYL